MAARGTGLPVIQSDEPTPLVDFSSAARPFQQLAAEASDSIRTVAAAADQVVDHVAVEEAKAKAAAGDFERRPVWMLGSTAYNETVVKAHGDRQDVAYSQSLDALRLDHLFDPDGFDRAADELRDRMIAEAEPTNAVALSQAFERRRAAALGQIRAARLEGELREAKGAAVAREEMLNTRILEAIASGALDEASIRSGEADGDMADWASLLTDMAANRAFEFSPEEIALLRQKRQVRWMAELGARGVLQTYRTEGADAGFAALQGLLRSDGLSQAEKDALEERASKLIGDEFTLETRRRVMADAAKQDAAQSTRSLIEAMRYGGDVDPDTLRAAAAASQDPGLIAEANYAIEVGVAPPGGASGSPTFDGDPTTAASGFEGWANFFFIAEGGDALIPNDNGRGPSRWGINQSANPDVDVPNLTRPQASRILRRRYWDAIGGDQLPPSLAFVAADAAAVAGVGKAREWIAASKGDVGRFTALQEQHYRALAAKDPAKYGDDLKGWLNRLNRARSFAARIDSTAIFQEGFAADPIRFAMGGQNRAALADIPSLPLSGAFGGQEATAWGEAIRRRQTVAATLASRYQVPARLLSNAEVSTYKALIAEDPVRAVQLALSASRALGPDGARSILREIGVGGAGVEIHVADLAVTGSATIADLAMDGMRRRREGVKPPAYETDETTIEAEARRLAPALERFPGLVASVTETANLARLADAANGKSRPSSFYVMGALGSVMRDGKVYGGVAVVNGRQVLLPNWIARDAGDDVLAVLADLWTNEGGGPVYSDGKPMEESAIRRLQMVALPNGNYGLVRRTSKGIAIVRDRQGRPYEARLEGPVLRRYLAHRLPGSIYGARSR